jgi:hypothetical protein
MYDSKTYMNKRGRDNDTGTELLDDRHDDTTKLELAEREEDWPKHTNRCGGKNGKHKTNTQRNVVVSAYCLACSLHRVSVLINAMPDKR